MEVTTSNFAAFGCTLYIPKNNLPEKPEIDPEKDTRTTREITLR
jgi:hypothetical protein